MGSFHIAIAKKESQEGQEEKNGSMGAGWRISKPVGREEERREEGEKTGALHMGGTTAGEVWENGTFSVPDKEDRLC